MAEGNRRVGISVKLFFLVHTMLFEPEKIVNLSSKNGVLYALVLFVVIYNTFYIFERHARRFREEGDLFVQFVSH